MTPVSVAFKKLRVFSIRNIKIIQIPNSLKKYRKYFPSVISVSDRFFMVLVVYKASYISVSDRFLFKNRFYFDICIGFMAIYYRNQCQTGEKVIYKYRVCYKTVIS